MTLDTPHAGNLLNREFLMGLARIHPFVLLTDRAGRVSWMNDRLCKRLEGDTEASLPESDQLTRLWGDVGSGGVEGAIHLDIQAANGTRASIEARALEFGASEVGEPTCVVIARPGVREADDATSESPAHQALERSPDGVLIADPAGYVTYANPRAASLLGQRRERLVGRPVALFLAQSPDLQSLLEKLREPAGWDDVVFAFDRGGERIWLSASTRQLDQDGDRPAGVITYLRDVTEQHRLEEELQHKNHELEGTVDTVAHDLRSPLVSLLGFTRLLKEDFGSALDEQGLHFLDRVETAGRTMETLIQDLLELSRIREPGEVRPLLDPRRVLQQLGAELKLRLEARGVELELPSAPPMMRIDGTRLYQIFSNLIGNALVHGFPEDRPLRPNARVQVEILERDDADEIVVCDSGCGIPTEDHERIFEVFQTGRGVRRSEHSHGIGLAIVKKIATSHGGRAWVESTPEQGARFHLLFPRN